ncbi:MAG: hypothetical protein RBS36_05785 [Thiomicrospira sp.]|jgi:hypothetical protein|nr:hypothetical protein [Thiomicrospira sp.]
MNVSDSYKENVSNLFGMVSFFSIFSGPLPPSADSAPTGEMLCDVFGPLTDGQAENAFAVVGGQLRLAVGTWSYDGGYHQQYVDAPVLASGQAGYARVEITPLAAELAPFTLDIPLTLPGGQGIVVPTLDFLAGQTLRIERNQISFAVF